jgi:hypothetical protein
MIGSKGPLAAELQPCACFATGGGATGGSETGAWLARYSNALGRANERPSRLRIETSTWPGVLGGAVARINEGATNSTADAAAEPKEMAAPLLNPVPLSVTLAPASEGPPSGEMLTMVGEASTLAASMPIRRCPSMVG